MYNLLHSIPLPKFWSRPSGSSSETNTTAPSPTGHQSSPETLAEASPTDLIEKRQEITLEEYIGGKVQHVAGLEDWAHAVRNGRSPITILGILQPVVSEFIADHIRVAGGSVTTTNSNSNRELQINSSCISF